LECQYFKPDPLPNKITIDAITVASIILTEEICPSAFILEISKNPKSRASGFPLRRGRDYGAIKI
jgi:hypothetical protein